MGKLGEISLREWCFAPADLGGVPKHLAKEGGSRGQTDSSRRPLQNGLEGWSPFPVRVAEHHKELLGHALKPL